MSNKILTLHGEFNTYLLASAKVKTEGALEPSLIAVSEETGVLEKIHSCASVDPIKIQSAKRSAHPERRA